MGRDMANRGYQATRSGVNNLMGHQSQTGRRQPRYSGPFVNEIRKRLDSYFAITVRNVRDSIPKAVGFYLVRAVQDKMQYELLQTLNSKEKISELLGEPPHILEERRVLTKQLDVLQKAHNVLTRDPTLASVAFEAENEIEEEPPKRAAAAPKAIQASLASPPKAAASAM